MSTPGSPAVIQPAIARPIPPPPPKPLSDRPAATQNPRTPGHRPEQRVGVGRHRVRMADEPDRLGVGEEREAADRAGHQRREPFVVGRQRAGRVLPRHAVDPARHRLGLVAAEEHAAVLALAVDEVVRVAEAGHVARQLVARDRPAARCAGGRPASTGWTPPTIAATCGAQIPAALTTSSVSIGPASVSTPSDLAARRQLEPGHADAGPDPDAERAGGVGHGVGRGVRVEVAVAGEMDGAVQRVGRDRRHQATGLVGAERPRRRGRCRALGWPCARARASWSGLDARRRLPTRSNTPSRSYSSML